MNFSIQRISENGLSLLRLKDPSSGTYADILPSYGALLHAFVVNTPAGPVNIIDNYKDLGELQQYLDLSYKSSKLSPFVCRIPEGRYEWQGEQLEFSRRFKDGSAIHGLLFNKAFKLVDEFCNEQQAALRLKYHYKKDDPGYPFQYTCEVLYTLHANNVLQLETKVYNSGTEPIPIADGWHPYFTLGNTVNDYELLIAADSILEFNDRLIPTGRLLHQPDFRECLLLGNRSLDNCFQLEFDEGRPVCVLHNPANHLTLSFFTNQNYPFLQVFTPDHRQSIAIENLSGAPDCFNNGIGVKVLMPTQTETFNVWYKLDLN